MKKEYKFMDLFTSIPSKKYQILQKEIKNKWKFPVISQSQNFIEWYSDNIEKVIENKWIIVFWDHTTVLKYVDFNFIIGADGVKLLKNKNKKDNLLYLYYLLSYNNVKQEWFKRHYSILKEKKIYKHTNIQEQQKIADFLSSIDKEITLLKKEKKSVEEYKKGMMQKIFSQELRFKDENGKYFGEWEEKELGEICKIRTGKLNANAAIKNWKYRFYTCAKDFYYIDNYKFDTEALLISWNWANVWYIHYYKGKFNAYQRTYVLDEFENNNILYIKYILDKILYKRIQEEKKGGWTPYITLDTLAKMKFKLPALKEQQKIVDFLFSIDEEIKLIDKKIKRIEDFKKGVMQRLFS